MPPGTKFAQAPADFDEVIRLHARVSHRLVQSRRAAQPDRPTSTGPSTDYNQAVKLQPNDPAALVGRGHAWYQLGENEDGRERLRSGPGTRRASGPRPSLPGRGLGRVGRYAAAADDYRAAIRLEPNSAAGYQAAAWMMATCPGRGVPRRQAGRQGVGRAISTAWPRRDTATRSPLAAALAEDGQFDGGGQGPTEGP